MVPACHQAHLRNNADLCASQQGSEQLPHGVHEARRRLERHDVPPGQQRVGALHPRAAIEDACASTGDGSAACRTSLESKSRCHRHERAPLKRLCLILCQSACVLPIRPASAQLGKGLGLRSARAGLGIASYSFQVLLASYALEIYELGLGFRLSVGAPRTRLGAADAQR